MNFLEERIIKDGVVKEGNILKVDSFLNHQLDVELFDEMGAEWAKRFEGVEINKILTIEASGIGIACVAARHFNVPGVEFYSNHMLEEIKEKGGEEYIGTISKQGVLGCNDIKFEIGELPWDIFLSFYKQNEGIFNHTSKIYQDNLVGVTTIIGSDYDANKISNKGLPVANKTGKICENEPVLCRVLVDRCKEWQSRAGKNGEISHLGRYFLSILNSLGKFEVSPIHDYLFQTMLTQMSILIDLAEQALNDEEEMLDYYKENPEAADRGIEQIRNAFFRSAYGFVREFSLLVQNSVRSDRQFTQAPDFDVRVYETPVKLLAFYNAYI